MPRTVAPSPFTHTRSPRGWRSLALVPLLFGLLATGILATGWGGGSSRDLGSRPFSLAAQSVEELGEDWPADRCAADRLLESPAWLAIGSPKGRIGDEPAPLRDKADRRSRLSGQLVAGQAPTRSVGSLWPSLQTREVRLQV